VLDGHFKDDKLKAVLSAYCGMIGLPASRLSAIAMTPFLVESVPRGRVNGGMQNLADALARTLQENGGDLLLKRNVKNIIVRGGQARGIVLDDGEQIEAGAVVSNADAKHTFTELVGAEEISTRLARQLAQREHSPNCLKVWLGVDMEIQTPKNGSVLLYCPSYHVEDVNAPANVLSDTGFVFISIPSLDDESLAPDGMHCVELHMIGYYYDMVKEMNKEEYKAFKERIADVLIARAEKVIPGLSRHIVVREVATPLTFERYTRNYRGASCGWGLTPEALSQALDQKTEIRGLYLAGHWTYPGGGIPQVMMSGSLAAKIVLGLATPDRARRV